MLDINEKNVDRAVWPVHHRWRAVNACLEAGLLQLSEDEQGYQLELPAEEKPADSEGQKVPVATTEGK